MLNTERVFHTGIDKLPQVLKKVIRLREVGLNKWMRVYVPSADTIKDNWEKAQEKPENAYYFSTSLETLINLIDQDPNLALEEIPKSIDSISHIHPFIAAVEALRQWHIGDGDYEHDAKAAIHLLSESIHRGINENHRSVFAKSLSELVELQTSLHHNNTRELTLAVEYLFDNHYDEEEDANGGRFHQLVDLVLNYADLDNLPERQLLHELFIICIIRGNRYANTTGENQEYEIETDLLCPWLRGKDIERWRGQWSGLHVILPHYVEGTIDGSRTRAYDPSHLQKQYPLTWDYFEAHRETLENRESGRMKGSMQRLKRTP